VRERRARDDIKYAYAHIDIYTYIYTLTYTQPEIEPAERVAIQEMFEYAARQGWGKGEGKQ
jgi:hypothetical protein